MTERCVQKTGWSSQAITFERVRLSHCSLLFYYPFRPLCVESISRQTAPNHRNSHQQRQSGVVLHFQDSKHGWILISPLMGNNPLWSWNTLFLGSGTDLRLMDLMSSWIMKHQTARAVSHAFKRCSVLHLESQSCFLHAALGHGRARKKYMMFIMIFVLSIRTLAWNRIQMSVRVQKI